MHKKHRRWRGRSKLELGRIVTVSGETQGGESERGNRTQTSADFIRWTLKSISSDLNLSPKLSLVERGEPKMNRKSEIRKNLNKVGQPR